jgi:dienelactone hydrolase
VPIVLFAACSVGTIAPGEPSRDALPLPEEIGARFDYQERGAPLTSWTCTLRHSESRYDIFTVKGEVTLKGDNHPIPVEGEYWQSRAAMPRGPVVLVTPILGGGDDIARLVAREFAESGLHSMIVWRGVKVLTPEWTPAEVEVATRRGIVARRRVIDWLETRPEVDPRKIAAWGVSMGGIATAVLAPVEPRIHSAVIAMAGGDLASVIMTSDEGRVTDYRNARLAKEKITPDALETELRAALVSDPALLGKYVDTSRFLMFVTRRDTTVPTRNQLILREQLGRPRTFDLPTGHYSAMAYVPFIRSESTTWLLERMRTPNPRVEAAPPAKAHE